jgi:hypothetical protein
MMRMLFKVLMGVVAVAVIGSVAAVTYWTLDEWSFPRRSPLAANLPANFKEASSVFRSRIIERFPVGSNEEQLISVLSKQGFRRNHSDYVSVWFEPGVTFNQSDERSNILTLTPGPGLSFPCRLVWNVTWRSNSNGQITEIYAEYHGICV